MSLLLPLYGVIARGVLAEAIRRLRRGADDDARDLGRGRARPLAAVAGDRLRGRARALRRAVAVLDRRRAGGQEHVPVLRAVRAAVPAAARRAVDGRRCCAGASRWSCGLALLFAAVGFYEYATGRLLLTNAKVQQANDLKAYFRVNSLFFDPNIYGRFLALTMILLAATLLWATRRQTSCWWRPRWRCCGRGSCCRSRSRASRRCSPGWRCSRRCAGSAWPVMAVVAAAGRRRGGVRAVRAGRAGHQDGLREGAGQGHQRPRGADPRGRSTWRATGRCGASARARSPSATGRGSTSAPRRWPRSRTRSRSRCPPSRA